MEMSKKTTKNMLIDIKNKIKTTIKHPITYNEVYSIYNDIKILKEIEASAEDIKNRKEIILKEKIFPNEVLELNICRHKCKKCHELLCSVWISGYKIKIDSRQNDKIKLTLFVPDQSPKKISCDSRDDFDDICDFLATVKSKIDPNNKISIDSEHILLLLLTFLTSYYISKEDIYYYIEKFGFD